MITGQMLFECLPLWLRLLVSPIVAIERAVALGASWASVVRPCRRSVRAKKADKVLGWASRLLAVALFVSLSTAFARPAQASDEALAAVVAPADAPHDASSAVCDVAFMGIELNAAMALSKDATAARAASAADNDTILELRAEMARERANPSGVVNLVSLHDTGVAIQEYTEERAENVARAAADSAHVSRLTAKVKKEMKGPACLARAKAGKAAKVAPATP